MVVLQPSAISGFLCVPLSYFAITELIKNQNETSKNHIK